MVRAVEDDAENGKDETCTGEASATQQAIRVANSHNRKKTQEDSNKGNHHQNHVVSR